MSCIFEVKDGVMIFAVLVGPILAVQVQKGIEAFQEKRGRRLRIFRTLMSARATPLLPKRVEALNLLEIEFYGDDPDDRVVLEKWKICLDHLNSGPKESDSATFDSDLKRWTEKLADLYTQLLQAIGSPLGYNFDEVQIKKGAYIPMAHVDLDAELSQLRKRVIEVLSERSAIQVSIVSPKN